MTGKLNKDIREKLLECVALLEREYDSAAADDVPLLHKRQDELVERVLALEAHVSEASESDYNNFDEAMAGESMYGNSLSRQIVLLGWRYAKLRDRIYKIENKIGVRT